MKATTLFSELFGTYFPDCLPPRERSEWPSNGYFSGGLARLPSGLPARSQIDLLEIRWNDGGQTLIDQIEINTYVTIAQS